MPAAGSIVIVDARPTSWLRGLFGCSHQTRLASCGDRAGRRCWREASLERTCDDLTVKLAGTPPARSRLVVVPLSSDWVMNPRQYPIMGPRKNCIYHGTRRKRFVTRRVTNVEGLMEQAHVLHIGRVEADAEFTPKDTSSSNFRPYDSDRPPTARCASICPPIDQYA